ncbi:MAG: hypothetical protein QM692_00835 [Thermomicrobiales bacterium]
MLPKDWIGSTQPPELQEQQMAYQADRYGDVHVVPEEQVTSTLRTMLNKVPEVTVFSGSSRSSAPPSARRPRFPQRSSRVGVTQDDAGHVRWAGDPAGAAIPARKYVPVIYWLAVVFISVVGTLITDYFTDERGVRLQVTTAVFSVILAAVFAIWYASERTLSIHTIVTTKREAFYWLAVLFTFALGTAAGDLVAEQMNLGYGKSVLLFAGCIAVVFGLYKVGLNAVLSFWLAYILTRPLGASIGDFLATTSRWRSWARNGRNICAFPGRYRGAGRLSLDHACRYERTRRSHFH